MDMELEGSDRGRSIRFIRDEPADQDALSSHAPLAKVVASTIRQQPELKVIGLLGHWGSGKSTVVKLIQAEFKRDGGEKEVFCFTYDAWLHQSDPPRRAFLETLIAYLDQEKLTTKAAWKDELDQLAGRLQDSEITTTPTFTVSGRIIALTLIFLPLGFSLIGYNTIIGAYGSAPLSVALSTFRAGLLLCLLPFLSAFIIWVFWRPVAWPWSGRFWTTNRKPYEKESVLSLFQSKSTEKTRNRIILTPEPTTIEFQRAFNRIIHAASHPKRLLVIIIDNLDRLPAQDSIDLWVTIRSLFLGSAGEKTLLPEEYPTVILPIDETVIERMYEKQPGDSRALVKSFMDKSFDLRFRVTRPVASAWNAYFEQKMRFVFGEDIAPQWIYQSEKLLEIHIEELNLSITPRDINQIVNGMGVLWLQWMDRGVSFVTIAYAAIFSEAIEHSIGNEVLNPRGGIATYDPAWQAGITAIHFGADPNTALQVLIEPDLRVAITENLQDRFDQYASVPGFARVLRRVIQGAHIDPIRGEVDPVFLGHAAALLGSRKLEQAPWVDDVWGLLRDKLQGAGPWQKLDEATVDAVQALLRHTTPEGIPQLVEGLTRRLAATSDSVFGVVGGSAAYLAIVRMLARDTDAAAEGETLKFKVPGGAAQYLLAIANVGDESIIARFETNAGEGDLVAALSATLGDQLAIGRFESSLRSLMSLGTINNWDDLATAASNILASENGANFNIESAATCLGLLRLDNQVARDRIEELGAGGVLVTRLNEAQSHPNAKLDAALISLMLVGDSDCPPPSGFSWAQYLDSRPGIVGEINTRIREYDSTYGITRIRRSSSQHPASRGIVSALMDERVSGESITQAPLKSIITDLPDYLSLLDEKNKAAFILKIAAFEKFWERMDEVGFKENVITILRTLLSAEPRFRQEASRFLKSGLESVSFDDWITAIKSGGEPIDIASDYIRDSRYKLRVGANLYKALQDLIPEVSASADSGIRGRWFSSARFIGDAGRKTLMTYMRDHLLSGAPVADLPGLLDVAERMLLLDGAFSDRADDAVRYVILPLIGDAEGLAWLSKNKGDVRPWVAGSTSTRKELLRQQLTDLSRGEEAASKTVADGLLSAWKLKER